MKRILSALLSVWILAAMLAGCAPDVARPEIKEGRFNLSVTYEQDGEIKTASGVYVCEYGGIAWTLDGDAYVNWKTHIEGDISGDATVPICRTEDGGEILISLLLYPEYFMGEPDCEDYGPIAYLELLYDDHSSDDAQLIAQYGVKLVGFEYDKPIENKFNQEGERS